MTYSEQAKYRNSILESALERLFKTLEYQDAECQSEQWIVDARKDRAREAIMWIQ